MKSTQANCIKDLSESKHITLIERQQIERWLKEKVPVVEIASRLNRHKSTIYRERQRGLVAHVNSDLSVSCIYQWDVAQRYYEKNKGAGGRYPKLHQAHPLILHLTTLININRLSPYAAMKVLAKQGHTIDFCEKTFYNHIGRQGFPIQREQLPMGRYRRRKRETPLPCRKHKRLKGVSIESRPAEVNDRKEPGHHEMDLVVAARGGKKALLVLTERVTRFQHIILIKDKTQKSVISAINRLERRLGKERFHSLFQSITCDNGVEFQNFEGIEKSVFSKNEKRTNVYFAHPYSSFERGSNENANRLIRRFLPKGTSFDKLRQRDVQRLAYWMNKNPRKILGGMSAKDKAKELGLDFYPAKS